MNSHLSWIELTLNLIWLDKILVLSLVSSFREFGNCNSNIIWKSWNNSSCSSLCPLQHHIRNVFPYHHELYMIVRFSNKFITCLLCIWMTRAPTQGSVAWSLIERATYLNRFLDDVDKGVEEREEGADEIFCRISSLLIKGLSTLISSASQGSSPGGNCREDFTSGCNKLIWPRRCYWLRQVAMVTSCYWRSRLSLTERAIFFIRYFLENFHQANRFWCMQYIAPMPPIANALRQAETIVGASAVKPQKHGRRSAV